MSTPNTKKYTPFWFTLVELIVVITILVILWTIAFTSLAGYSGSARDSSRISDLTNISKGLDIAYAKTSSYPMPDSYFTVTYSGWNVWYQWEVGTTVMNILTSAGAKLSKQPPLDPLVTTAKYTYSKVAYAKDSYQLKANWEGDKITYSPTQGLGVDIAQAASWNPTVAYIAGNYNWVVAKTQTGTMTYILAVPSIISNTGSIWLILAIDSAQKTLSWALLTNGWSNTTGVIYNPVVAYASGSLPSTTAEKTALATGIATAYSGTTLASVSTIQPYIVAYAANDTTTLASLGGNAGSSVGGSNVVTAPVVAVSNPFASCVTAGTTLTGSTTYAGCNNFG
jgi:prepilin-type N-terminal cleavage/methylation domain-containing protein